MRVDVRPVEVEVIEPLRDLFRAEADCQIVRDSILPRGLADAYLATCDGEAAGYGGVWNEHFPNRVVEFHTIEQYRETHSALFRAFIASSGARDLEAQTNMPGMLGLLEEFGSGPVEEHILFKDGPSTRLECPGGQFRRRRTEDEGPEGEWVVEVEGEVVAGGGVLTHYNPPYRDIYMEVDVSWRRAGIGCFIVQELRRVCHDRGWVPAARCDPGNVGSRRTLERGGMVECGRLLAARIRPEYLGQV